MKTCPHCGADIIESGAASCPMCGSSLGPEPSSETATQESPAQPISDQVTCEVGEIELEDSIPIPEAEGIPPEPQIEDEPPEPESVSDDALISNDDRASLKEKLEAVVDPEGPGHTGVSSAGTTDPAGKSGLEPPPAPTHRPNSEPTMPTPKMAGKGRGVAYFWRNFVQISGHPGLRTKDELIINDREYELRPKTIDRRWTITAAAACLTLLLVIIGIQFVDSGVDGQGTIMGIVLDENGHPYLQGAVIRLPESDQSTTSNAQGFFVCRGVPLGTHQVEYLVAGQSVAREFATVVDDEITTLYLTPEVAISDLSTGGYQGRSTDQTPDQISSAGSPSTRQPAAANSRSSSRQKRLSDLTLAANVEQARLVMDGEVLGAGNITYAKLAPGRHSYSVSAEGYEEVSGTIVLEPSRNNRLEVTLSPIPNRTVTQTTAAQDHYYAGKSAVEQGRWDQALESFNQAIELKPSYVEAYEERAAAYIKLGQSTAAHGDFVRAAEIHRIHRDFSRAITDYNRALEADDESLTAHLGRGDLYLAQHQELAAIADYDAAADIDEKNARAHFGLGQARFQRGNYGRAIEHFKEARSLDRSNPLIYQYLMLAYFAADEVDEVRKAYREFADIASDEEIASLRADSKYEAVLRVAQTD